MDEKKNQKSKVHNVILENRQKLCISGVVDVDSFNEEYILTDTELGLLIVRGQNLKINRLNLEIGELIVEGNIGGCEYTDDDSSRTKNGGFLARIFGS